MTSTPLPGRLRRIYRGWIVVAAGCLAETIALGAGGSSFSVLLQPMSAGLKWSRTLLTGAVTTQSILNLGTSPIIGTATDRYGPRIVMVAGAAVASVGYLLIGRIVDPIPFYIVFALAGAAGLSACGPLVTETVVAKWFTRQRGRALAITAMGLDFGNIIMVPLTALLIAAVGWQATWMVLGTIIAMVLLPVSTAFMSSPKAGDVPEDEGSPAQRRSAQTTAVWTAREAFFKGSLWKLIVAFNLASVAASALIYHLAAYFLDSGFTLQQASLVLALNRVFAIGSKLIWGFLAERVPVRYCLAGNSLGRATGFLILLLSSDPRRAYLFALVGGLSGNAFGPLQAQILADYYGSANLGAIRGLMAPFGRTSGLLGPLLAAFVWDQTGSYNGAFWVFTLALMMSAVAVLAAKPPKAPVRAAD